MRWKKRRPPAQRPAQMQAEPRQRMQEGAMAWQAGPAAQSQAAKNPAQAGFFDGRNNPAGRPGEARSGGLERLDARGQAALVAGGLVLVDQAAGAGPVEQGLGRLEGFLGADGVVGDRKSTRLNSSH